ncbi:NAD(P)H-hydrate dehydratase, partial [Bordetella avium]
MPALIAPKQFPDLFAPRPSDSNKGSFGSLGILGGGPGMTGAALLAARAALKTGAGKVLVGLAETPSPLACDPLQPELMVRDADHLLTCGLTLSAWTAGCGIGTSDYAIRTLSLLFQSRAGAPLVLDADGLNLLASGKLDPSWGKGTVVLTPHPAEAARLLACATAQVQADRPAAAKALARRFTAWIVLKGAGSLVCAPDGACLRNPTGNPGLATAGTGDVLAGMLGALLAQSLPPEQAVPAAVWLHGAAADALAAQ